MSMPRLPLAFLCAAGWIVPVLAQNPAPAPASVIGASDPRFRYEGWIDFANPAAPVVIWQGTRISLDFEGPSLAVDFAGATGQNFFNVGVDGAAPEILAVAEGGPQVWRYPGVLGAGRHHLELFKRSEAAAGVARFGGVELQAGARAWRPAPPAYRLAMEFIGDSITVGACNEDGAADQWSDRRTHNNALSYGALTAAAFDADYRNLAVSGMGVVTGWVPMRAGQIWDRLYPEVSSPRADLAAWQPDVAFVNFGENDDSFTRAHQQPFPPTFAAAYVALVRSIRQAYPRAEIVLLRGGMYGGANSGPLREAWEAAVRELEAADPAVSHFVFTHWTGTHPRVADDRALADELTAWLKHQLFMRRHS